MTSVDEAAAPAEWHIATTIAALHQASKVTVEVRDRLVLVLWNDGQPVAMDDTCIHRQRSLSEGVLLNGRIVCPGHQWAFDLETGLCNARDRYQPMHAVRVDGEQVLIALCEPREGGLDQGYDASSEAVGGR
jgi:nitrite reductase (NADH) small subunit